MATKKNSILDELNKAIAAELTAVTQYMWHHVMVKGMESESVGGAFKKASIEEMKHAEKLAERLDYLGGVPTTKPLPIGVGGDMKKMIQEDMKLEVEAIKMYKAMIKMCADDSTTRRLLEEILEEEEGHLNTWQTLLGK
jgi:bacterioferritin